MRVSKACNSCGSTALTWVAAVKWDEAIQDHVICERHPTATCQDCGYQNDDTDVVESEVTTPQRDVVVRFPVYDADGKRVWNVGDWISGLSCDDAAHIVSQFSYHPELCIAFACLDDMKAQTVDDVTEIAEAVGIESEKVPREFLNLCEAWLEIAWGDLKDGLQNNYHSGTDESDSKADAQLREALEEAADLSEPVDLNDVACRLWRIPANYNHDSPWDQGKAPPESAGAFRLAVLMEATNVPE